jgi:aminoglycoside 6'-N-acetyltransferase I
MRICDLNSVNDRQTIEQVARLLLEGFDVAWPTLENALEEVRESLNEGRISRVGFDQNSSVLGWIGGKSSYGGSVWELHPLVVSSYHRHQGVGRMLVQDFEAQVKTRSGLTILLGTDDDGRVGRTSLWGVDLYPDVLGHVARIKNLAEHPYEFYLKLGYTIVGVIPDANGPGKPDILMAKSIK